MGKKITSFELHENIVWEILVRLPTKSLMRFKCVSKLWRSIICDPNFVKEHTSHGAFRGLFLGDNSLFKHPDPGIVNFFYASLPKDDYTDGWVEMVHQFTTTTHTSKHQFTMTSDTSDKLEQYIVTTEPVKGLIVLFDTVKTTLMLCNIATRELVNLPNPASCSPPLNLHQCYYPDGDLVPYHYHLGFDHTRQVFKLLKLTNVYDYERIDLVCNRDSEIMTLGDGESGGKWRVIDSEPPIHPIESRSLWINDSLYWLAPQSFYIGKHPELIEFHLPTETFRTVPIPDYVCFIADITTLARIGASPALIIVDDRVLEVWTPIEQNEWKLTIVELPEMPQCNYFRYAGTLPTGEMLFACRGYAEKQLLHICIYDHIKEVKKMSRLMTIGGIRPSKSRKFDAVDWLNTRVWHHQENIIPLSYLVGIEKKH